MTKEELKNRIEKSNDKIAKIEKRIAKWSKGLRPEDIAICEPFGSCIYGTAPRYMNWRDYHGTPEYQTARKNYEEYYNAHKNDIPFSDDWNKGPNIGELYNAYRDLGEARHTLEKYENELKNLDKFDSEEKIPVIWEFLQKWRTMTDKYYHDQAKELAELKSTYEKDLQEYKNSEEYKERLERLLSYRRSKWSAEYDIEKSFKKEYFEDIDSFTFEIALRNGSVDEAKLNKSLDAEMKRKYEKLVKDVTDKAGEIVDASNLKINARGEISGTIVGTKNTVNLWLTFVPGNIQRPHYRGYCHIAK